MQKGKKEGTVTWYGKEVNYLLENYVTDDIIAETDASMVRFTQPSNKSLKDYTKALYNKAFGCNRIHDEYVLKKIYLVIIGVDQLQYVSIFVIKYKRYST